MLSSSAMASGERGPTPAEPRLPSEDLRAFGEKWVNRGKPFIPRDSTSISISLIHHGYSYLGTIERHKLKITKCPKKQTASKSEDETEGETVATNNGQWDNPMIFYQKKSANPTFEDVEVDPKILETGITMQVSNQVAKSKFEEIAEEFFDALESTPAFTIK